jgi:hypothetical protein
VLETSPSFRLILHWKRLQLCCFAIEDYNVGAYRPVGEEGHSVMSQQPAEFMHLNGGIEPLIGL